jgi:hypothetical protein
VFGIKFGLAMRIVLQIVKNLDLLIKDMREIAEEVGLDNVGPVVITEVLDSHSQPISKELYDLA